MMSLPLTAASTPTFSKDVAPILYKNCATCHRTGDIAPMPLLTYEQARPWAASIREEVASGQMPPWHSSDPHGTFSNDRRLSDADKDTLLRWASGGAPQGDPKDMPPLPKFTEGWQIGTPDVVLSMTKPFEVPAKGTVNYQFFQIPTNFTEDKWVQAIEVRPGVRSVVHHILVFSRDPGASRQIGRSHLWRPVQPRTSRLRFLRAIGEKEPVNSTLIATTAPGTNAMVFAAGDAMRIRAGATLLLQVHYTANGTATTTSRASVSSLRNRNAGRKSTAAAS